jgi:hypothetical protein
MVTTVPLIVETDAEHGGRWTSLRGGGREWLWHSPDPARATARPGQHFIDAGGLEECVPTVRGTPDHGDAWSRRWRRSGDSQLVQCPDFVLLRRIIAQDSALIARYTLHAEPGYHFIWAAHALLDLRPEASLAAPAGTLTRLYPEAAAALDQPWPDTQPFVTGNWPGPCGIRLDRLGPDDGTAVGAILLDCPQVTVHDGPHSLSFALRTDAPAPVSVALWRNLRGYPPADPYRSIGIEPMLGAAWDRADALPGDAAIVPVEGRLSWDLHITATRLDCESPA